MTTFFEGPSVSFLWLKWQVRAGVTATNNALYWCCSSEVTSQVGLVLFPALSLPNEGVGRVVSHLETKESVSRLWCTAGRIHFRTAIGVDSVSLWLLARAFLRAGSFSWWCLTPLVLKAQVLTLDPGINFSVVRRTYSLSSNSKIPLVLQKWTRDVGDPLKLRYRN